MDAQDRHRLHEADVLRGFALVGIGLVNIPLFAAWDGWPAIDTLADRIAVFLQTALFSGKSFPLFAFLFGWGMVQMDASAKRDGRDPADAWRRRMLALFAIGAAHAALAFAYDILMIYAVLGLACAGLRNLDEAAIWRRVRRVAIFALVVSVAVAAVVTVLLAPGGVLHDYLPMEEGASGPDLAAMSYWEVLSVRLEELPLAQGTNLLYNGPLSYISFCLGILAARRGLFAPGSTDFAALARRASLFGVVGFAASAPLALSYAIAPNDDGWLYALTGPSLVLTLAGAPFLCAAYVVWIVQLARGAPRWTAPFAASGRMSLTAYVLEGVAAGLVFYGYGLGLYGQLGMAQVLLIALAIVIAIKIACALWLRIIPQGPLEMLSRAAARSGRKT
jgi:uncharacterized protein